MSNEAQKDLDTVVGHFKKKKVHMVVSQSQHEPDTWELEEIENKSDIHGAGSEALQHLAIVADKHKKHIWLLPAGRKGQQKHLTDYYKRHGFKHVRDPYSGLGLMHREPGAKMNLDESKKSECPSCGGIEDVLHEPKGRKRKCRNCYKERPYPSRMSAKRKKLENTLKSLKEDVPTNSMGASSSAPGTGAIDTYDPVLDLGGGKVKNKMRKKLFDILRRKLAEK